MRQEIYAARVASLLLMLAMVGPVWGEDWPTHRHDSGRSG